MKKSELTEMTVPELKTKLQDDFESLQNFRFQKALQQLENPVQIKRVKKDIAQVKTLLKGKYPSGSHKVIWYGKDDSGDMLSGGLYVCKLITEQDTLVSKMLLIKK
jgi:large subunit ribosomal protein L29